MGIKYLPNSHEKAQLERVTCYATNSKLFRKYDTSISPRLNFAESNKYKTAKPSTKSNSKK